MAAPHIVQQLVNDGNRICAFIDYTVKCTLDKDPITFVQNLTSVYISRWTDAGFGCVMCYGTEVCNFAPNQLELLLSVLK